MHSSTKSESATSSPYEAFLVSKVLKLEPVGIEANGLNHNLFPFQADLVRWSARKGRCALFADTGLGKTLMQLAWAEQVASRALILAPLAVTQQTVNEGQRWGIPVTYARLQDESPSSGITITNYEMLKNFDPSAYSAVVLDESSILKSFTGKTRTALIQAFQQVPLRLCCTATPAPNDITEIANHAEFLSVMSRVEMLASFFVHDDNGWRLKKHAREPFYRWLASWSMSLKKPSDLGYSDEGYVLPPLNISAHYVASDYVPSGMLFPLKLHGIRERAQVRRETMEARVQMAASLIDGGQCLVWCGLNDEGRLLKKLVPDLVLIEGADNPEKKTEALINFSEGQLQRLGTKIRIAGFGMNFQSCSRMIFVGLGDSYEQYYQAIRRCWRFGQKNPVNVHIVLSEIESEVYDNVLKKEREAQIMSEELLKHVAEYEKSEITTKSTSKFSYTEEDAYGDNWHLMLGDSVERIKSLDDHSVDLAVFSPPFGSLYTYSPTERDLGNSRSEAEFWSHFSYISRELLRVMKPGRNVCVHVQQLPTTKQTDGFIGIRDFRGQMIRHFQETGFVYHGEVCIDKDPQAQAIRTHSKGLLFVQKDKDSSWLRPAFADYIIIFRAPGDNAVPIKGELTNEEWIEWARPIWYGIKESDTLNAAEARGNDDERHICPLQLGTIERCVRLWSNRGETVFSPFAGIGSEGYQALLSRRKFVGVELKPEYFRVAIKNLKQAERKAVDGTLFASLEAAI